MTLRLLYHLPLRQAEGFLMALGRRSRDISRRGARVGRRRTPYAAAAGRRDPCAPCSLAPIGALRRGGCPSEDR